MSMNRMDQSTDQQLIANFNSDTMTQKEMKQIHSQQYNEIKKLKEEIEKGGKDLYETKLKVERYENIMLRDENEIKKLKKENDKLKQQYIDFKSNPIFSEARCGARRCRQFKELQDEIEKLKMMNSKILPGYEMCEVYKGRMMGIEAENKELKRKYNESANACTCCDPSQWDQM